MRSVVLFFLFFLQPSQLFTESEGKHHLSYATLFKPSLSCWLFIATNCTNLNLFPKTKVVHLHRYNLNLMRKCTGNKKLNVNIFFLYLSLYV